MRRDKKEVRSGQEAGFSAEPTRIDMQSSSRNLDETARQTSAGRRIVGALASGLGRRSSSHYSPTDSPNSPSLLAKRQFAFPILAVLAVAALGLWLLLPGGALRAQDAAIMYAENGTDPVATFTASDPEGARAIVWSLVPSGVGFQPIDVTGDEDTDDDADITAPDVADFGKFKVSDGVLSFKSSPNYEVADEGGAAGDDNNEYKVVVRASDGGVTYAYHKVTVMVTNVEEDGTVTLSALQPQVEVVLTATHSDPDGGGITTGSTWKWERSAAMRGPYTAIPSAGEITYTPTGADEDKYLRATVSYTDAEGPNKTAMATTAMKVRTAPDGNSPPEFPDQNPGTTATIETEQTRTVAEKTPRGTDIGDPVSATDGDDDTLTYTLSGTNAESFGIDPATGQLKTKASLNFEGGTTTYAVTVEVRDPFDASTSTIGATDAQASVVTITVTNVDEAPSITNGSDANAHDYDENLKGDDAATGAEPEVIQTFMATDPEDITTADPDRAMTWSVMGSDESLFSIEAQDDPQGAELTFKKAPDYEKPGDANEDNVYEVTVVVTDSDGMTAMRYVTVKVMNMSPEAGTITLSSQQPKVGVPFTAELTDKDGSVTGEKWEWRKADAVDPLAPCPDTLSFDNEMPIEDANGDPINSDTYTPKLVDDDDDDAGKCLQAKVTYTDGYSVHQEMTTTSATAESANPVVKDADNRAPAFKTETATRMVDENTAKNMDIGVAVEAKDKTAGNEDVLTYTLGGTDAASFKILEGTGQLQTKAELDHEEKPSYMVTVTATDPAGLKDSIAVTIMVMDVDEAPEIIVGGLAISGPAGVSYAENGTGDVATYTLAGPNADSSGRWMTLGGADAGDFTFTGGVLSFRRSPNYEAPADADMDNMYMVTLTARDGTYTATPRNVVVTVTDVEDTTTPVTDGTLLDRFDTDNDNDMIDKVDVTQVIRDYLFGDGVDPSKADVVAVIRHYLFS